VRGRFRPPAPRPIGAPAVNGSHQLRAALAMADQVAIFFEQCAAALALAGIFPSYEPGGFFQIRESISRNTSGDQIGHATRPLECGYLRVSMSAY